MTNIFNVMPLILQKYLSNYKIHSTLEDFLNSKDFKNIKF